MTSPEGQPDTAVIKRTVRIIAPTITPTDGVQRQPPGLPRDFVGPEKTAEKAERARGRCAIALPLGMPDPGPPERAANHYSSSMQPAGGDLFCPSLKGHAGRG